MVPDADHLRNQSRSLSNANDQNISLIAAANEMHALRQSVDLSQNIRNSKYYTRSSAIV